MAQARMPELAQKVREIYHKFPLATWEPTRKILDGGQPYKLFVHIEELISTNKIDDVLAADNAFRELAADMYAGRHPRLRDPDLGAARWRAYQEHEADNLRQAAKEAEKHPEQMLAMRRNLMVRRLAEGLEVERWRKLLGFEGVHFDQAEIEAAREKEYGTSHAYGEGEPREDIGGMEVGGYIDGPGGSYGELPDFRERTYHGPPEVVMAKIPKAPADGGEAPRNPFTTEWRAREAPDGIKFPAIFDPYYTSNQFIRRSKPYKPGKLPELSDSEDEQEQGDDKMDVDAEGQKSDKHLRPTAMTAVATLRRGQSQTETQTMTEQRRNTPGPVPFERIAGGPATETTSRPTTTQPGRRRQLPPLDSFTVSTRTVNPDIIVTGSPTDQTPTDQTPTDQTTHTGVFSRLRTLPEEPEVESSSAAPTTKPGRIYTPTRQEMTPSPPPTPREVEMTDRPSDGEDADMIPDDDDPNGEGFLVRWMNRYKVTPSDTDMMAYRGWRIHSPAVQLIRAKNFLADEDVDRTMNWDRKFAEIGHFLRHCVDMKDAARQSWWPDLRECIRMLHAHWVFQEHHYGQRKVVVDLPQPRTSASTRLPMLLDGRGIAVVRPPSEELRPRYLVHRTPESVQDVDYQIPGPLLYSTFMTWFREDGNLVWESNAREVAAGKPVGSGHRGEKFEYEPDFNMALTEDEWYAKCMAGGPETTAEALRGEANFYIHTLEYVPAAVQHIEIDGKTHRMQQRYPEGEALHRFARYRGAKRAALQQCLSHFNSVENIAIQSPYRKLVLPLTKRQRQRVSEEAGRDIVYQPKAISEPPEGVKLDPLGLTFWFHKMRECTRRRAEATRADTIKAHREFLGMVGEVNESFVERNHVLLPANFLGPVTPLSFLTERERKIVQRHELLQGLRFSLRRAYQRSPRQMLEGMVKNLELGKAAREPWDMREELYKHRTQHKGYLDISDMELHWLFFVCGPSTNVVAQRMELPDLGREFEVFVERVQKLLDDPNIDGVLASYERHVPLKDMVEEVNKGLRDGDFVYDEETVKKFCKVLANRGRLGYETSDVGDVEITRPQCDWHPENRLNWPEGDDPWDPVNNPWNAANLPRPEDTWDWELAFANISYVNSSRRLTKNMLWSRAWRVGWEMSRLEEQLRQIDERLGNERRWDQRSIELQDLAGRWRRRTTDRSLDEDGSEDDDEEDDDVVRMKQYGPVSYGSVVKAGAPEKWPEDGGMEEKEAYEIVRRGVIDELSAGDSTLWPSRPRFTRVGNDDVMTLHRERVWDWARPEVVGEKPQFFSINRWPVHLQTEETQERIRRSADDRVLAELKRKAAEAAEMARVEEEVRPTDAELVEQALNRSLAVPYHEGEGRKNRFVPGGEFWGGVGRDQQRAIGAFVQDLLDEDNGEDDGLAPPAGSTRRPPGFSGGDDDDDGEESSIRLPEVNARDVPRSVPGTFPAFPGGLPTRTAPIERVDPGIPVPGLEALFGRGSRTPGENDEVE
ncbi:hypothetical protein CPLU01_08849 [Colletotrichum plurivorum]|uniref:Uncharacterized protein n=1 Tax=Colletotrichum plurivorum TaxID=2175906 RepID=A0A8H6KAS7_9PEZI|nr:hypothetical protein CPLU01_08849 [Colletotrichum plurivorum]